MEVRLLMASCITPRSLDFPFSNSMGITQSEVPGGLKGTGMRAEGDRDPGEERIKNGANVAVQEGDDGDLNQDRTVGLER